MTTIAYRDGVMAADSRITYESEAGGARVGRCEKLYRIDDKKGRALCLVGLAGEAGSGLVFLEWLREQSVSKTRIQAPSQLISGDADFSALVVRRDKTIWEYDKWCVGDLVLEKFWAVGSGAKAALGALHAGCDAVASVRIACRIDPYSAPPITVKSLRD